MNKNAIVSLCSLLSVNASEDDTAAVLTEKLTSGISGLVEQMAKYKQVYADNEQLLEGLRDTEREIAKYKQQLQDTNDELLKHLPQGDQDQDDRDTTDEYGMPDTREAKRIRDLNTLCKRLGIPERTDPLWDHLNIGVNGDVFWVWFPRDLYGTSKDTNAECFSFLGRVRARAKKLGLVAWFRDGALNIRTMKRNFTPM